MPTVGTFMGMPITMYFDDHAPPHFHARAAERNAKVRIDVLEVIESDLRRRELRLVLVLEHHFIRSGVIIGQDGDEPPGPIAPISSWVAGSSYARQELPKRATASALSPISDQTGRTWLPIWRSRR